MCELKLDEEIPVANFLFSFGVIYELLESLTHDDDKVSNLELHVTDCNSLISQSVVD